MDKSSPFSSQSRSFRFLFEPIKASTEKACARELRATADLLLSLILAARTPVPVRPATEGAARAHPHAPSARRAGGGSETAAAGILCSSPAPCPALSHRPRQAPLDAPAASNERPERLPLAA